MAFWIFQRVFEGENNETTFTWLILVLSLPFLFFFGTLILCFWFCQMTGRLYPVSDQRNRLAHKYNKPLVYPGLLNKPQYIHPNVNKTLPTTVASKMLHIKKKQLQAA